MTRRFSQRLRKLSAEYAPTERRPLGGYVAELAGYGVLLAALAGAARLTGRRLPDRVGPADLALLTVATHKLARLIAKDSVTSPLRAPFTRFKEPIGHGEVMEEVRDHQVVRHAVGELLTCPFCLGVWVCTALAGGLVLAPRATRMVMTGAAAVTGSDFLQFAYTAAQRAAEPPEQS
ncbi:DUF1360 domain-containing protein [Pilimelia columellifera subsp. columellifera]|uniref:DUF1360 domain-containing protein n=1 Tax=Pilimelia columellifera subsp. columellifera TaxID=706583 RepID=A0ABP6ADY7_9ACTN